MPALVVAEEVLYIDWEELLSVESSQEVQE
jgi:hypothetical protein